MGDSSQASVPWGRSSDGLALRIDAPNRRYRVEEEVEIFAELRNVGDRDLRIASYAVGTRQEGPCFTWLTDFLLLDRAGAELESTGPIVKQGGEPRLGTVRLSAGETHRIEGIPVSSLSVESQGEWRPINSFGGEYFLQLVYSPGGDAVSDDHWSGEVRSNLLEIVFE